MKTHHSRTAWLLALCLLFAAATFAFTGCALENFLPDISGEELIPSPPDAGIEEKPNPFPGNLFERAAGKQFSKDRQSSHLPPFFASTSEAEEAIVLSSDGGISIVSQETGATLGTIILVDEGSGSFTAKGKIFTVSISQDLATLTIEDSTGMKVRYNG